VNHNSWNQDLKLTVLDKKLISFFSSSKTYQEVIEHFFDELSSHTLSLQEQAYVSSFFLLSGGHLQLLEIFKDHLKKKLPLAWNYLVETLSFNGFIFNEESAYKIFEEAKKQNLVHELVKTRRLDPWIPQLAQVREQLFEEKQNQMSHIKEQGLAQVDLYRVQQMEDQELQVLRYLSSVDPHDPVIQSRWNDLNKRRSQKLLELKIESRFLTQELQQQQENKKDLETQNQLLKTILERVNQDPFNDLLIYNYAIFLTQTDCYDEALILLNRIQNFSQSHIWLKVFLLSATNQFLKALEYLDNIETQSPLDFFEDGSFVLALQYERALLYWKLNQKSKALMLVEELLQLNPDYRDASTLARQWRGSSPINEDS
jgi:tetratricopeptide (TPR) repeat protein